VRAVLRRSALLAPLLALWVLAVPSAQAHLADPRIRTVLDDVSPALPEGVVVQAVSSLAEQLVVANPTATVLSVLDNGGRPFLQISRAGVQGNLASLDFYTTANPGGTTAGIPADVLSNGGRGAPRWVPLSKGDSWGWFDHRLHPAGITVPTASRRTRLFDWTVPMTYGSEPVTARGHVDLRPLLGSFLVTADAGPAGLQVQVLQGRLPGLFLTAPAGAVVTVPGRDGEPFLELAGTARVNVHSRTFVEDRQAQGRAAGPPSPQPLFRPAEGANGASFSWLDARLQYPHADPPEAALRSGTPTTVQRWRIPVTVDGRTVALTGAIRWVPNADAPRARAEGHLTLLLGAALALAAAGLWVRLRRKPRPR
jgi:hypothetical protein